MFRNLLLKIKKCIEERKYQRRIELKTKRFHIRNAVIKWYLDYDKMNNVVDIPAYIRADEVMKRVIKRPADIDKYYKKLLEYQQTVA